MKTKKEPSKRYWLVYTDKGKVEPRLMTFKESEKEKLRIAFYWEEIGPAERYLEYINGKF